MGKLVETVVEQGALNWIAGLGGQVNHGPDTLGVERDDCGEAVPGWR